jgi:predicted dehydrogenase
MMDVIIVGAGYIGQRDAKAIAQHESIRLSSIVDKRSSAGQELANQYSVPFYSDLNIALSKTEGVDLVRIATPPGTHYDLAVSAIQSNKSIYVEKIMTIHSEQAEEILDLATDKDVGVYVRRNAMYKDVYAEIFSRIDEIGKLRRVDYIEATGQHSEWSNYKSEWLRDLPGGIISEHLPHPLYLIRWYLEDEPSVIDSRYHNDELYVDLAAANKRASISFIGPCEVPMLIRIIGSEGVIEANHNSLQIKKYRRFDGRSVKEKALKANLYDIYSNVSNLAELTSRYSLRYIRRRTNSSKNWHDQYSSFYWQLDDIYRREFDKDYAPEKEQHSNQIDILGGDGVSNVRLFEDIWRKAGVYYD